MNVIAAAAKCAKRAQASGEKTHRR
jgi:hypothetical protein